MTQVQARTQTSRRTPRIATTLAATVALMTLTPITHADDWPQWRGPDRTDRSAETGLLKSWPSGGPKLLWQIDTLGLGFAGPAIVDGRMYILSDRGNGEELQCLDLTKNGKEVWSTKFAPHYDNNWGDGPRSTPTVDGDRVYVMGSLGDLACMDIKSGKVLWSHNLGKIGGNWGYTQSPLVDGDLVVAAGRKKGAIRAFNKISGKEVWSTSSGFNSALHYSSMIAIDHGGVRQFVMLRSGEVLGLRATDGKVLWNAKWHGRTAVIPTPIYYKGHVYITSGYGQGCMLVKLADDSSSATVVYDNKTMKNHHGGVIRVGDYVYGHNDSAWVCQDFMTGEMVWNSRDLGKGSCTYADGMLYCFSEAKGECVLIEASPKGWKEHGRFKLPKTTKHDRKKGKIWVHPVISDGKLYLRDQELLFCFDVKE